jgi:hypothetical protein
VSNFQRPPIGNAGQPGRPGARPGQPGVRPGASAQRAPQPSGGKPAPAKGAPVRSLEHEFSAILSDINKFRVDILRFLAGDLHVPPEELRERIAGALKKLRNGGTRTVAEAFRLTTLEAQFNSQVDVYTRKLRERELGGGRRVARAEEPTPDASQGVVYGQSGHANAVEVLYKGLYLQSGNRTPAMDLERFRDYVSRQAEVIRSKTGCSDIQFRVEVEEGKLKLKAKPLR